MTGKKIPVFWKCSDDEVGLRGALPGSGAGYDQSIARSNWPRGRGAELR